MAGLRPDPWHPKHWPSRGDVKSATLRHPTSAVPSSMSLGPRPVFPHCQLAQGAVRRALPEPKLWHRRAISFGPFCSRGARYAHLRPATPTSARGPVRGPVRPAIQLARRTRCTRPPYTAVSPDAHEGREIRANTRTLNGLVVHACW